MIKKSIHRDDVLAQDGHQTSDLDRRTTARKVGFAVADFPTEEAPASAEPELVHHCHACGRYATFAERHGAARVWYGRDHIPLKWLADPATSMVRTLIREIEDAVEARLVAELERELTLQIVASATVGRPADVIGSTRSTTKNLSTK
jgi:hypothetical protein